MIEMTKNHTGKMEGINSISTSVVLNPFCQAQQAVKGSICSHCFAEAMMKMYSALEDKLASPDMFTSIRDIAMVYGIIVDKDLKIKEIEATKNNVENINKNISNIANLLNNPKPNRSEKDV